MARKKKIDVRSKVTFKKPLKSCYPALDELMRVRKNETNRLYRLNKKFDKTRKKTEADKLRREIKSLRKGIETVSTDVKRMRGACEFIDSNRAQVKSLHIKNAAIKRKLNKMAEDGDYDVKKYKELDQRYHRNANQATALGKLNKDKLYDVNKSLGFSPDEVAARLGISRKDLEKYHAKDFPPGYFDEELIPVPTDASGASATGEEEEEPYEDELAESQNLGYEEQLHDVFWRVWQDYDKNVTGFLDTYNRVEFIWGSSISPGGREHYKGSQRSMLALLSSEVWRWANAHDQYIMAIKLENEPPTKLKYILYYVPAGNKSKK